MVPPFCSTRCFDPDPFSPPCSTTLADHIEFIFCFAKLYPNLGTTKNRKSFFQNKPPNSQNGEDDEDDEGRRAGPGHEEDDEDVHEDEDDVHEEEVSGQRTGCSLFWTK
ncbi:unnamed protein product [Amoebophrya sp. A120]|nr:unnamed protein product [Amoebophrya sp. A120]|eukprot:GSA120T00008694001.1